jgi:hypothetical protein
MRLFPLGAAKPAAIGHQFKTKGSSAAAAKADG